MSTVFRRTQAAGFLALFTLVAFLVCTSWAPSVALAEEAGKPASEPNKAFPWETWPRKAPAAGGVVEGTAPATPAEAAAAEGAKAGTATAAGIFEGSVGTYTIIGALVLGGIVAAAGGGGGGGTTTVHH